MGSTSFSDCLDSVQMINKAAIENAGEDSFYCAKSPHSAIVGVFDGCGGLGARRYDGFSGKTGAYIASRAVSGAVRDWYHSHYDVRWQDASALANDINSYIARAYAKCAPYSAEKIKIMGSMVRKLPTTLAMAYAEQDDKGILVHVLWAGDSRVYLLDADGLAQLTLDDTDVPDAFDNLQSDGAMNNVLSSDGNYVIHSRTIHVRRPTLIIAATDGCFGYVSAPMEFEHIILSNLMDNDTPKSFRKNLRAALAQFAGDDLAMGIMSFYCRDYAGTRSHFRRRLGKLEQEYITIIDDGEDEDNEANEQSASKLRDLWMKYKPGYERYLRRQ